MICCNIFLWSSFFCTLSWPILLLICSSLTTALSLSMSDTPLSVPDPALCSSSSSLCLRRRFWAILGCRRHSEIGQILFSDCLTFYQIVNNLSLKYIWTVQLSTQQHTMWNLFCFPLFTKLFIGQLDLIPCILTGHQFERSRKLFSVDTSQGCNFSSMLPPQNYHLPSLPWYYSLQVVLI